MMTAEQYEESLEAAEPVRLHVRNPCMGRDPPGAADYDFQAGKPGGEEKGGPKALRHQRVSPVKPRDQNQILRRGAIPAMTEAAWSNK